jgi:hypothetical protein
VDPDPTWARSRPHGWALHRIRLSCPMDAEMRQRAKEMTDKLRHKRQASVPCPGRAG